MQTKLCKKIKTELPGVIILSHGLMATGIVSSLELLYGEVENVDAFSLEVEDAAEDFGKAFWQAMKKYESGCIVFADIFGGTPSNQLLKKATEENVKIFGFAGMNLPLVLEAVTLRETMSLETLMEELDKSKNESICNLSEFLE